MSKTKGGGGLVFSTNRSYLADQLKAALGDAETAVPEAQRLTVRRDAVRRRGKIVTLVEGFEGGESDLSDLGKRLKQACGAGGSAKEGEILIQGDVAEKVLGLLIEWGYTKSKIRR